MDNIEEQDVNQTESTVDTSSEVQENSTPETTDTTSTEEVDASSEARVEENKVPLSVVKELRDEIRSLKAERLATPQVPATQTAPQQNLDPQEAAMRERAKSAFKDIATELGYVSKDDLQKDRQDQALESTLSTLEKKYDGKNGLPKFDRLKVIEHAQKTGILNPEVAFKNMNETEWLNWHVQQAMKKGGPTLQTEGSNGSGSQNVGATDGDLKAAALKGDSNAKRLLLRRISKDILGG